jgi:hypothetical protein
MYVLRVTVIGGGYVRCEPGRDTKASPATSAIIPGTWVPTRLFRSGAKLEGF